MLATLATLCALLGIPASAGAQAVAAPRHYVALGDSYTAGPLIPVQRIDPIGCERSTSNYPSRLAAALGIRDFTDVSCSGAKTENMTAAQSVLLLGTNPPQFNALRPDTDLVTLTISGNDIGFTEIVYTCGRVASRDPFGNPCEREATAGGGDLYAQRIEAAAPKVARVIEGIHQRSPHATVLLVGYLRILPPTEGCYPLFPIARGDVRYLDGLGHQLTDMLASQAFRHDAFFVDSYTRSLGHDACHLPGVKWVEGPIPTSPAAPVHPNALGMQAVAGFAADTLRYVMATVG
ncbi:MAG TPA: SGNH/GDSL hydrolase family protein [Pseudonocardiaceae bacterium]|jgi:lysophospholipase L1-like esterase|nr:SGNH/GDSL hydrolase family protein [Pseudonocardiaceae bacterium]